MTRFENTPSGNKRSTGRRRLTVRSKDGTESLVVEDYSDMIDDSRMMEEAKAQADTRPKQPMEIRQVQYTVTTTILPT